MSTAIPLHATSERTTADVVAGNIRAEAARLGMSQVALGRTLGMTQNQITTRWKGQRPWQLEELDSVADALDLTVQDLVTEPEKRRTPTGGSHRAGPLRARRDSNPQPSDP